MKQILIIHGGDAYDTYEGYLESLRNEEFDIDDLQRKGWKDSLALELKKDFQVIAPKMPNPSNAKYLEWKIWFEKIIPSLKNDVVLIGHSLGGMFLARYLAENKFPKNIAATMLVSSPHTAEMEQSLADFIIPKDLKLFEKQGGKIFLYYSSDDPFIGNALDHMEAYRKSLPKAIPRTFSDRGHFLIEKFPEIIEDIRNL